MFSERWVFSLLHMQLPLLLNWLKFAKARVAGKDVGRSQCAVYVKDLHLECQGTAVADLVTEDEIAGFAASSA